MLKTLLPAILFSISIVYANPIVPGYERLKEAKHSKAATGEVLLSALNCAACHQADDKTLKRLHSKASPDLSSVGKRVSPQYLKKFISNPHKTKEGTMMPDLLHGLPNKDEVTDELVHYLVSLGGPMKESRLGGTKEEINLGKKLFESIGCIACHQSEKNETLKKTSIPLGNLAMKTDLVSLRKFLLNPHQSRPSGRMPNFRLSKDDAHSIAMYLLREQLDHSQNQKESLVLSSGLSYKIFEGNLVTKIEQLSELKPKWKGTTDNFNLNLPYPKHKSNYAVIFEGSIDIQKDGNYTFFSKSDDASHLYIDRKQVVNNGGFHGMQERGGKIYLKPGLHKIKLIFAQGGGGQGLEVKWIPPGGKKQVIPNSVLLTNGGLPMKALNSIAFSLEQKKANKGQIHFNTLGCASCHTKNSSKNKPLMNLDLASGCLSDTPTAGQPNFHLTAEQKSDLKAGIENLKKEQNNKDASLHHLASFNCIACHTRDELGGPGARDEYFKMSMKLELGDEGRIPPTLDDAGAKLKKMHSQLSSHTVNITFDPTWLQRCHLFLNHIPKSSLINLLKAT